ncbi:MAG: WD40-repeat-containing domain protein [Benniella sp.]|nr:MAG: WD40-repeat-containing domain protein [Benniella sp.]
MFSRKTPSSQGPLSPQQALELANIYLEKASKTTDPDIALILCCDTEFSLSEAKEAAKHVKNQTVIRGIARAYIELEKLREGLRHTQAGDLRGDIHASGQPTTSLRAGSIAQAINTINYTLQPTASPNAVVSGEWTLLNHQQGRKASPFPAHIFAENVRPPVNQFKLPKTDERLNNTSELALCLGLLKSAHSSDYNMEPTAQKWLQAMRNDTCEQERLRTMATDVIEAFKRDGHNDTKAVAEVVRLAPGLDKDAFYGLLKEIHSRIDRSDLLDFQQLEVLAHLIQGANPGHLTADDIVKTFRLLSIRLRDTYQQPSHQIYQLTLAVSHILDAMADAKITGMDRKRLRDPLSSYLDGLKESSDPFLVYQAAYAYQAMLCVPDNVPTWQTAMPCNGKTPQDVSRSTSAEKEGFDLVKFILALEDIQKGFEGASNVIGVVYSTYDRAKSLVTKGQGLIESLKEGLSFNIKRDWYSALRGADILIRDGQLATFKDLVCEAPCRYDPAFQWGVCQRLGEIAADPRWDEKTRQSAITFLGEIYKNDESWGQHTSVKYWILNILTQLSSSSEGPSQCILAGVLLQKLETIEDVEKQVLYQTWKQRGPTEYPSKVALPEPVSPSLIDQVQNKLDIEGRLRLLRRHRIKERGDIIFIPPQARSNLEATDGTQFSLMDKAKEFLDSDRKVFLVLGGSGSGKSAFSRELEFELWQSYKSKTGRIPLHVDLPAIRKPECDMIAKQLRKADFSESQIRKMKHHRKFILICDGYDESHQTNNLYTSNQLNQTGEWDAQMVITCRSENIGSKYRDRFQPGDRNRQGESALFQEAAILPFSLYQVHDYIRLYVSTHQPQWEAGDYMKAIDRIPGLKDLVTNPLLMALSLDALPRLVDNEESLECIHVTRSVLYDHFVEQWLERSKARLAKKDMSLLMREAFEKLNAEGFTLNGIGYLRSFAAAIYKEQDGHPIVEYSQSADQGSWKEAFFSSREMQILHEACPLTRNGNQHQFIHRSLLEHELLCAVFDPQDRRNRAASKPLLGRRGSASSTLSFEIYDGKNMATDAEEELDSNSPLVWRSFVNDHSLLQVLEEQVRQDPVFKKQLLAYIELSKKDEKWRLAAANAITILVRAGVQFIEADLRGVRIPGADLSYGLFDSAQFQGADMRKVTLRGAWLRQADLSRADMTGIQLGWSSYPRFYQPSSVKTCAFSPDGELFALGFGSGDIGVCPLSNWKTIRYFEGHGYGNGITKVVFSPKGDLIASAGLDKTVRLWNTESGKCLYTLTGHTQAVNCVAFSPQGDQIASASDDGTLRSWDPATGYHRRVQFDHAGILCVVYSPKGDQIASGGVVSTVRLWCTRTGACDRVFTGGGYKVLDIQFSPQGDRLATVYSNATIRLCDIKTGCIINTFSGHLGNINTIVYSPKGDQIVSGSQDGTMRVWDVESGICRYTRTADRYRPILCVAFSPDDYRIATIATGGSDVTLELWDVSVRASRCIQNGHGYWVVMVKCSPKGNLIATYSLDNTIRLWDPETGACHRTISHNTPVSGVAFSPQGDQIYSACYDAVRVWDVDTGVCQRIIRDHFDWQSCAAYSPEGDRIVSASSLGGLQLWDMRTGEWRKSRSNHYGRIVSVVYSADGRLVAAGSDNHTIQLWDVGTMNCFNILRGHRSQVTGVAFSPQGFQVASGSNDGSVRLWNVNTGICRWTLTGHAGGVICVAYSHQGDLLASGSWDRTVRLWNVASGQCRGLIQNFQDPILDVVWNTATGVDYLVTGSRDGSVLKWQITGEREMCRTRLCWCATNGSLTLTGASIKGAHGLTSLNKLVLRERGAVGGPEYWFNKARDMATWIVLVTLRQSPTSVDEVKIRNIFGFVAFVLFSLVLYELIYKIFFLRTIAWIGTGIYNVLRPSS